VIELRIDIELSFAVISKTSDAVYFRKVGLPRREPLRVSNVTSGIGIEKDQIGELPKATIRVLFLELLKIGQDDWIEPATP
jgi:hypothetical protein